LCVIKASQNSANLFIFRELLTNSNKTKLVRSASQPATSQLLRSIKR